MRAVLALRHGRVQVGQALDDDVLPLLERDRVGLLAVRLQRLLARFELRSLLRELLREEVGRLFGRRRRELDVLPDVGLAERVRDLRRQHGIGRAIGHVHQPAVADGFDVQVREEPIDDARLRRRLFGAGRFNRPRRLEPACHRVERRHQQAANREARLLVEQRVIPELQRLDRAAREAAAAQDGVLRLVVVVRLRALVEHFLERHDVRRVALDQDARGRLVDPSRGDRVERDAEKHDEEGADGDVTAPVQDLEVMNEAQVRVAGRSGAVPGSVAVAGPGGRVRRRNQRPPNQPVD